MKDLPEAVVDSKFLQQNLDESVDKETTSNSEHKNLPDTSAKVSLFSSFFTSNFSLFERNPSSFSVENNPSNSSTYGWTTAVKNIISSGSMRRLQDRVLGSSSAVTLSSTSEIWFLGKCYNLSFEESHNPDLGNSFTSFLEDFSSRIWITYRKGFEPIGDLKFTCDVSWGCMIRSSQMLIAQTLILHYLGRSWRKPSQKPYDFQYIKILRLFGDSSLCTFSIHNLLKAGKDFGLAAGSWLGPYAMCRTWETIAHAHREQDEHKQSLPIVLYVVSGDKDGEQGGAPVICIEVVSRLCHDFNKEQLDWAPLLFLVPLVLGLEKINPRYIPLLRETFTFPQSLGILGGKPGASTYIVGVQDEKALYLDPHEVQTAVDIKKDDLESDCSSYHCSTVRHLPLDTIDPSIAIGFYCRDEGDFEDFCSRATQLADKSGGAPLFTLAQKLPHSKPISHNDCSGLGADINNSDDFCSENLINDQTQDDDWQIL